MDKFMIHIVEGSAKPFGNTYRERFSENRFTEKVRIDQQSCVYRRWPGTIFDPKKQIKED